jgi:hypothetical protein
LSKLKAVQDYPELVWILFAASANRIGICTCRCIR